MALQVIFIFTTLAFIWTVWILTKSYHNAKREKNDMLKIPLPPKSFLCGHLFTLLSPAYHRTLSSWARQYGDIFRLNVLGIEGLVVSSPKVIGQILGQGDGMLDLPKLEAYQQLDMLWSSKGTHTVFTAKHTDHMWKLVRKAVAVAFSAACIRKKFAIVRSKVEVLAAALSKLGPEQSCDLDNAGMRLALDVVSLAGFGYDFHAVDMGINRVIEVLPQALEECQRRFMNPFQRWSFMKESKYAKGCAEDFRNVCREMLVNMRQRLLDSAKDVNIGFQLISIVDPQTGRHLHDDQVIAEIGTFIMAGYETTAHTLSFTLYSIAAYKNVQNSIFDELHAKGLVSQSGFPGRELHYDDLRDLSYLSSVLKESMRMFPVVTAVPSMHNSTLYWQDPEKFTPERWLTSAVASYQEDGVGGNKREGDAGNTLEASSKARSMAFKKFLPFSEGSRNCVGQGLAIMELKTAIAILCTHFEFRLAPEMGGVEGVTLTETMALTLHTSHGIRLQCIPRPLVSSC